MKIYTRVVLDMSTGDVLEEDSYEYEGPIAECKGGGSGEVKETAEERELARIAAEQWNDYQRRFVPVENAYMDRVRMTDADRSFLEGRTANALQSEYSEAEKKLAQRFGVSGVAPGSGKFISGMTALNAGRGAQIGVARAAANETASDLHVQGLQSVVSMGRGQANQAQVGLGQAAAKNASDATSRAFNRQYESAATGSAIGSAVGMGLRHSQDQ